jgi:hypothetical protein
MSFLQVVEIGKEIGFKVAEVDGPSHAIVHVDCEQDSFCEMIGIVSTSFNHLAFSPLDVDDDVDVDVDDVRTSYRAIGLYYGVQM